MLSSLLFSITYGESENQGNSLHLTPVPVRSYTEKSVIIIFDRGYDTQFKNAKPILDKYRFKVSFFIICSFIDGNGYYKLENTTVQMFIGIMNHIPSTIQVFEIAAHNHMMAESTNGQWFISGAGGRKLYNFTQDPDWSFVNNKEHGYLQIKINNTDGKILSTNFYGLDGRPIS